MKNIGLILLYTFFMVLSVSINTHSSQDEENFVGDETCMECHEDVYENFWQISMALKGIREHRQGAARILFVSPAMARELPMRKKAKGAISYGSAPHPLKARSKKTRFVCSATARANSPCGIPVNMRPEPYPAPIVTRFTDNTPNIWPNPARRKSASHAIGP